MESSHLAEAHALSVAVGWPHRIEDWVLLLELGRGFVALDGNRAIGTIMWWPFGPHRATLGMFIVAPDRQGRGIGRLLMETVLAEIGPRQILLNATKEGLPLYAKLGFEEVGVLGQHQGVPSCVQVERISDGAHSRLLREKDVEGVAELDARAAGFPREAMLRTLLQVGEGLVMYRNGQFLGHALLRRFGRGHVIGPVAASDERVARALINSWMERYGDGFLRIDAPSSSGLSDWLSALGLRKVDDVCTMQRGAAPSSESEGPRLFALASQALG